MTIGSANQFKEVDVPDHKKDPKLPARIKLDIWDTPGAPEMQNVTSI